MSLTVRPNFGWLPDLPDFRDKLAFPAKTVMQQVAAQLPPVVDLRKKHAFNVLDQGTIGSCVAHAVGSAIEFAQFTRPNNPDVSDFLERDRQFQISRLFLYYEARRAIDMLGDDSGCHIRDAMRVAYNIGVPRETGWKYVEEKFAKQPPKPSYTSAPYHKITSYSSVAVNNDEVRTALAGNRPVVIGLSLFDSFYDADHSGEVPMPRYSDQYLGGHAMLIVGYDDSTQRYDVLNSWGTSWGANGYCTIPYGYIGHRSLGADYWVLTDDVYKERMV